MFRNGSSMSRVAAPSALSRVRYSFKPRFMVFVAMAALIFGLILGLVLSVFTPNRASAEGLGFTLDDERSAYASVQVGKGDTIWTLAAEYGDPKVDLRVLVKTIRAVNNMSSALIYPGQTVLIPLTKH